MLWLTAGGRAADITVAGDWFRTIDKTDLTAGAGSDLASQYESATGVTTVSIANTSGATWRVTARRSDATWNSNVSLWVKRTSDGSGSGSISGGTTYVQLSALDTEVFSGTGDRSNVTLQFKLTGMSKSVAPGTYSTTVIYTVTTP
jgi:hypothetical protein